MLIGLQVQNLLIQVVVGDAVEDVLDVPVTDVVNLSLDAAAPLLLPNQVGVLSAKHFLEKVSKNHNLWEKVSKHHNL
jgi:hypothetical protein